MKTIVLFLFVLLIPINCLAEAETFVYNDHGKRDPLWPLVLPTGVIKNYDSEFNLSEINIDGIMYEPNGGSIVIINGNIFKKNDTYGPFVVLNISEDFVILKKGEEKIKIRIKKEQ